MPRLTFAPLYPGSDLHDVRLGRVLVGRTSEREGRARWICWLASDLGLNMAGWRDVKSPLAARNAISAHVADWLRRAGLDDAAGAGVP